MQSSKDNKKSSCPFGDHFYSNVAKALLSDEAGALDQLKEYAKVVEAAKIEASDELWDSGDEISMEAEAAFRSSLKSTKRSKSAAGGGAEKKQEEKAESQDRESREQSVEILEEEL